MKQAQKIEGTPLSISIYTVRSAPVELCSLGKEEIILCLRGSVNVSFFYRNVTLHEGEFVAINHDMFYMSSEEDNLCVSFYFDTQRYEEKYPNIAYRQHVCVGAYSDLYTPVMGYPTPETDKMLGMLLTLLYHYTKTNNLDQFNQISDLIVDSLIEDFDVIYFMNGNKDIKEDVHKRLVDAYAYVYRHYDEKFTYRRMAELLGISENYVNEYLRKGGTSLKMIRKFAKLYAAERMLVETDKTILEIAADAGFSNPKYLYFYMKEWMDCTPNELRKNFCEERKSDITYLPKEALTGLLENEMIIHFLAHFTRKWDE